ncbi:MAG: hypothetical protein J6A59_17765, partial [Lachnospiraceae bacterium]|nr:hypothetical protein [Lachnospiraceae bacterium]
MRKAKIYKRIISFILALSMIFSFNNTLIASEVDNSTVDLLALEDSDTPVIYSDNNNSEDFNLNIEW